MRLTVSGISKTFGRKTALQDLSFTLLAGEFVALIGPNGAGKSTLLKILTGQLLPTTGEVKVDGVDVHREPDLARERMGIVPEEPVLYPYLSAREFLEFVLGVRRKGDINDALFIAGLGPDADRPIREYSQGMRRRAALAAAVLSAPALLVLDESINGLDPESALRVEGFLMRRCEAGATVLLSTHLLDSVSQVATRVLMLKEGRMAADVKRRELGGEGVRGLFAEVMGGR